MTLAWTGNVANAVKASPTVGLRRVSPNIVEPCHAVRASEQVELITIPYDGMICSCRWDLSVRWAAIDGILDQDLPAVRGGLQSIEIESNKVVEEVAFDLPAKYVDSAAEDVESVAVAAWRPRTSR